LPTVKNKWPDSGVSWGPLKEEIEKIDFISRKKLKSVKTKEKEIGKNFTSFD